jgi:hypothetical protein
VQRILKEEGVRFVQSVGRGEQSVAAPPPGSRSEESAADLQPAGGHEPGEFQEEGVPDLPSLSGDDAQRLRGALDELLECDRVLSSLKTSNDA